MLFALDKSGKDLFESLPSNAHYLEFKNDKNGLKAYRQVHILIFRGILHKLYLCLELQSVSPVGQ